MWLERKEQGCGWKLALGTSRVVPISEALCWLTITATTVSLHPSHNLCLGLAMSKPSREQGAEGC